MLRKLIFSLGLFAITSFGFCQVVFFPPGALWTASYKNSIFSQSYSSSSIAYIGDTIVAPDTLKMLSHSKFFTMCNTFSPLRTFIRQKGDTIFMKNRFTQNQWEILFNFACTNGQGWVTTYTVPAGSKSYSITVDSSDILMENGFSLRRLFVTYYTSYGGPAFPMQSIICEKYGWGFLFQYTKNVSCDGDFFCGSLSYSDF